LGDFGTILGSIAAHGDQSAHCGMIPLCVKVYCSGRSVSDLTLRVRAGIQKPGSPPVGPGGIERNEPFEIPFFIIIEFAKCDERGKAFSER